MATGIMWAVPRLSYRQRILVMLVLLALFMAGIALQNTVSEPLGLAVSALALVLSAVVVFGDRRRG